MLKITDYVTLDEHQEKAVKRACEVGRLVLWHELGTGKTLTALAILCFI